MGKLLFNILDIRHFIKVLLVNHGGGIVCGFYFLIDPSYLTSMERRRRTEYVIKDPRFGEFTLYKTANAWWKDRYKLERLMEAFKAGHLVKTACVYAGITYEQYVYFNEIHQDFKRVKEACEEGMFLRAMDTINGDLGSPITARWYLSRRHPNFNQKLKQQEDSPVTPVHKCPEIDVSKIEKLLSKSGREFLARESRKEEVGEEYVAYTLAHSKEMADAMLELAKILSDGSEDTTAGIMADLTMSGVRNPFTGLRGPYDP